MIDEEKVIADISAIKTSQKYIEASLIRIEDAIILKPCAKNTTTISFVRKGMYGLYSICGLILIAFIANWIKG